jgi:hypothetical protein
MRWVKEFQKLLVVLWVWMADVNTVVVLMLVKMVAMRS